MLLLTVKVYPLDVPLPPQMFGQVGEDKREQRLVLADGRTAVIAVQAVDAAFEIENVRR